MVCGALVEMEEEYRVMEIKVMKKPREDDARRILDRVAKQVQPIMRRHKWKVKLLSEFCPASLLGLNVNGGSEVRLRLRKFKDDGVFIPFEQVLDTMLHELCHNKIGPHSADFYKLWDELRWECDDLISKGITGEGFDGRGRRLGGFIVKPPLPSLRQTALNAAEKRRRMGTLLTSGPQKLGGNSIIMKSLSPIQAAAMAAERRMQDELWCGSGSYDISAQVDRVDDSPPQNVVSNDAENAGNGSRRIHEGNNKALEDFCNYSKKRSFEARVPSTHGGSNGETSSSVQCSSFGPDNAGEGAIWECTVCTLLNQDIAPICGACGSQKPKSGISKSKSWSCKFCTLENSIFLEKCSACEQWRYSFGPPPFSTPTSTLGT